MESNIVGKGGTIVIPARLRRQFGIKEGTVMIAEKRSDGILLRPAQDLAEIYTPERKAEFLLSNAMDAKDYARAVRAVRKMGLDPARVRHHKPRGVA